MKQYVIYENTAKSDAYVEYRRNYITDHMCLNKFLFCMEILKGLHF